MRAVLLVLLLVLAGCSAEVTGAPEKDDAPVVGPVDLVVPIELRPVVENDAPSATELPDPSGENLGLAEPVMTIERLDRAEVMLDQTRQWALSLTLTSDDSAAFTEWTANHIGERLAMVIDGEVVVAPTIQDAITSDVVYISGNYTQDDVRKLLDKLTGR